MRRVFYILLLTINLVLAVALLLSYFSTYISPARIWFFAFLGLIYPYLLFANLFFIFLWAIRLKREAFISLVIILLGMNHLIDYIPLANYFSRGRPDGNNTDYKELKILSYNVRAFNIFDWLDDQSTPTNIFNLIRSENPDIICMQEYYTGRHLAGQEEVIRLAFKETPYSHVHFTSTTSRAGYGIATYSRYPIVQKGAIRFPNTNNFTIYSDIVIDTDTIRVYNNHLQSLYLRQSNYDFMDSLSLRYNDEQFRQVKDISRRLKNAFIKRSVQVDSVSAHIRNSPYPVIVSGDFNDTPVSYTYRKMRAGLVDSFVGAGGGIGNTYMGVFPSYRIDYIFHSPIFITTDFERIRAKLSDHYPIICRLKYLPSGSNDD